MKDTFLSVVVRPVYWEADRIGVRGRAWQRPGLGRKVRVRTLRGQCADHTLKAILPNQPP